MATIRATTSEKIFQTKSWGGLNESPDGDTKLKLGEAAVMQNFKVTRDGNLQRRPGTKTLLTVSEGHPIKGLWRGNVSGTEMLLCACNGKLWKLWEDGDEDFTATEIGSISTANTVHFVAFSGIVYMLNGMEYKQYNGTTLSDVVGYRPLVTVAVPPAGGGETLEGVNKLNGLRRCWISPDGTATEFTLPENGLASVDWVKDLATGADLETAAYTVDLTNGKVTFTTAPAASTNSYEIAWTMGTNFSSQIKAMRYSEIYSGTQDTRVFIYGDGSYKALYSGVDYDGAPRADYFPDMNEMAIGDENTPITGMIRHYSSMAVYKSDSAWIVRYGTITLADGSITAAFYSTPANRSIGNAALGQVCLVDNSPRTLYGNDLFEWKNNSSYSANLTTDERQTKRISDRVYSTLSGFSLRDCYCYDDNDNQEYYICWNGKALVNNYAADAWYNYSDFDVSCMVSLSGKTYIGSTDGKLKNLDYEWLSDDGEAIDAYWESGAMSFGQDYMRKYSALLWIGIKPESNSEVSVTVQTDRQSTMSEKVVESTLATFGKANFGRWSFSVNRKPHMTRLKIKAKKFVFYKLIFKTSSADTTVTVTSADIRVRFTGAAK